MNTSELLFLTIPAALVALKLAFLILAVVLVTRSVFKPQRLIQARVDYSPMPVRSRDGLV